MRKCGALGHWQGPEPICRREYVTKWVMSIFPIHSVGIQEFFCNWNFLLNQDSKKAILILENWFDEKSERQENSFNFHTVVNFPNFFVKMFISSFISTFCVYDSFSLCYFPFLREINSVHLSFKHYHFSSVSNHTKWFHVKSEWQRKLQFCTLCLITHFNFLDGIFSDSLRLPWTFGGRPRDWSIVFVWWCGTLLLPTGLQIGWP